MTAILNLADEHGSDEAVRSDRRDSRGVQETCKRRDCRIRDPTWRKREPTWRKREKDGEKANSVGEQKIVFLQQDFPEWLHGHLQRLSLESACTRINKLGCAKAKHTLSEFRRTKHSRGMKQRMQLS